MSTLEIILIIFGILFFIGIIIVIILIAAGVFESDQISKILSTTFSIRPINDSSIFVTTSDSVAGKIPTAGDILVLSSSANVKCADYEWNFKDNFLELNTSGLVASVANSTSGTPITLSTKGSASDLNQWEYDKVGLTWCLKSNKDLCMFNKSNKLTLETSSLNTGFSWIPVEAIKTPACS